MTRIPPRSTRSDTLFPYTTLFRSVYPLRLDQTKRGFWNESREARFQCDDRDRTRLSMAPDQTGECSSCGFLFPKGMCHALSASGTASSHAGEASNPRVLRSEERRVGKESVSTRRSRGAPYHTKTKKTVRFERLHN